jgi:hypothetical protein
VPQNRLLHNSSRFRQLSLQASEISSHRHPNLEKIRNSFSQDFEIQNATQMISAATGYPESSIDFDVIEKQ